MKKENIILKIWRIIYPIGIHFGINFILSLGVTFLFLFQISFEASKNGTGLNAIQMTEQLSQRISQFTLPLTFATALIAFPIMLFFYKRDKKRIFNVDERAEKFKFTDVVMIVLLSVVACLFFNNLISISNIQKYSETYQRLSELLFSSSILVEVIVIGICAPIVEEFVFRGLIYKRLKEYTNPLFGMLFSSFLFGLYHMNIVQGIYAFCLGMILAFLFEKFKSLKAPILAHISANIWSVILTELIDLEILERSLAVFLGVTIISGILMVLLLILLKKKLVSTIEE